MEPLQAITSPGLVRDGAGVYEASKKTTVIRLRWLIVIISSYLLLFAHDAWITVGLVNGVVIFYILTNVGLYFAEDRLFNSTYFYSPLVVFDTLFVTACLVVSGQVGTDFYLAYFLIIILCTVWQDFRGLVVVAVLATSLYCYFLIQTTTLSDPSIYLRVPFLFVISLFYGYFAQVVRIEKGLKEQAEQKAQDMALIHTLSQSLPSSLDHRQILETLGDKINHVVHGDWFYVLIRNEDKGPDQALLFGGGQREPSSPQEVNLQEFTIVNECLKTHNPVIQRHARPDLLSASQKGGHPDFSFPLSIAVPIIFREEAHGAILLGFSRADRAVSAREIQFCQIVAFATAISLSSAKKFEELNAEARRQMVARGLVDANYLKSEYLANMAHELRTPIATIMGYGNLMLDGACGQLTDPQEKCIGRLMDNSRRLLVLTDQILDYSRLEKGEKGLYVKRQAVAIFMDDFRRDLGPIEGQRPYKIQYDVPEGLPPVETDWGKLKSILTNLLSNAVRFTDQGAVRLAVTNGAAREVSFIVSDTGVGIPKDQIPLIFNKFYRVNGSAGRHAEGTGLGLAITSNLVKLLGGKIEVESEVGNGSTFKVSLPTTIENCAIQ